jgi:uncharacterized membrane protein YphA (DoxX/SURF4 family)
MADSRAARSAGAWILSILLAAIFLTAGLTKLTGSDPILLEAAGMRAFPGWIRIVVGVVETTCAIALLVPATSAAASLFLALLMIPATFTQFTAGQPGAWVPSVIFFFLIVNAYLRAGDTFRENVREIRAQPHPILRDGIIAGVLGATAIAVWFLIVDVLSGRAFFTPITLGRALFHILGPIPAGESDLLHIVGYTIFHYTAFIVVGILAATLVRAAAREPSVLLGFVILFVAFEIGFHAAVALLQETTDLGALAWYNIMAGNLIAAAIMGAYLYRTNPALRDTFSHTWDAPRERA